MRYKGYCYPGGYEIPVSASSSVKRVFRALARHKTVTFTNDDGPSLLVHEQIRECADAIGVEYKDERYEITLFDKTFVIDGSRMSDKESDAILGLASPVLNC